MNIFNLSVSIIIPAFNSKMINRTISSLKCQSHMAWECIIVDDGSDLENVKLIEDVIGVDNRFVFVHRYRGPKGAQTCRNIGAELAQHDLLLFLDSDDTLLPFCLKNRCEFINNNPNFDFYCFGHYIDSKKGLIECNIPESNNYLNEFLNSNFCWHTMGVVWQKDSFKKIGGFREGLPRFNDPELMIRAMVKNLQFRVFLNTSLDCIYYPSTPDMLSFSHYVLDSLKIIIPYFSSIFPEKSNERVLILSYLRNWFGHIFFPSGQSTVNTSIEVVNLFYSCGLISLQKRISLIFYLFAYRVINTTKHFIIGKIISK